MLRIWLISIVIGCPHFHKLPFYPYGTTVFNDKGNRKNNQ